MILGHRNTGRVGDSVIAGNHEIALKNSDGVTFYHKRVAMLVGQTTKLHVS